jgi:hypothetical protein
MRGAIPPLPQYVFMAWCLVKHRDNFTFLKSRRMICVGHVELIGELRTVYKILIRKPESN